MSEEKKQLEQEMPLGLYWKGKRTTVDRTVLPFQHLGVVETINESRGTREAEKGTMFRKDPDAVDTSWRNKLIWGDNKYAMAALLEKYAGKIDLIYIDNLSSYPYTTCPEFVSGLASRTACRAPSGSRFATKNCKSAWLTAPGKKKQRNANIKKHIVFSK